jgi:hypothetical protein
VAAILQFAAFPVEQEIVDRAIAGQILLSSS